MAPRPVRADCRGELLACAGGGAEMIIDINSPNLLPPNTRGPMTPEQFERAHTTGRVYRLTRNHPRVYVEYFVEAEQKELGNDKNLLIG